MAKRARTRTGETYVVVRDGEVTMRLPGADVRADGTIWHRGMPVIDGQAAAAATVGGKAGLVRLLKARDYDAIPADCFARVGESATGLLVLTAAEWDASRQTERDAALAARTPAQVERAAIEALFSQAEARREDRDDMNVSDHFRLRAEATRRLAAWRERYPTDARAEDAAALREKAAHERRLASGALGFSADGWIDEAGRKARRDEHVAKAEALEAEAAALDAG